MVSLLTEAHGRHAGLAKGGASRAQAPVWQRGNLVEARWVARLPKQLGSLTGELVHPAAALAMEDPLALALLAAAARWRRPRCRNGSRIRAASTAWSRWWPALAVGAAQLCRLVRWEAALLADLGYGLDLSRCAINGSADGLG